MPCPCQFGPKRSGMTGAAIYTLCGAHSEPQFGPGGGLPGDYPGDSLLRTRSGHEARLNVRIGESLDERTDAGLSLGSRLRLNQGTGSRADDGCEREFRLRSRSRLIRGRSLRSGSGSCSMSGEENDGSYDAGYGERSDAIPERGMRKPSTSRSSRRGEPANHVGTGPPRPDEDA
jgi:hypothetical protein